MTPKQKLDFFSALADEVRKRGGAPEDVAIVLGDRKHRHYQSILDFTAERILWAKPVPKPKESCIELEVTYGPVRELRKLFPESPDVSFYEDKHPADLPKEGVRKEYLRIVTFERAYAVHVLKQVAKEGRLATIFHAQALLNAARQNEELRRKVVGICPLYFFGTVARRSYRSNPNGYPFIDIPLDWNGSHHAHLLPSLEISIQGRKGGKFKNYQCSDTMYAAVY